VSDCFQILADVDATAEEAAGLAESTVAWLVAEGIVLADRTDCVVGADLGHPPGPGFRLAVETYADEVAYDGLEVRTGRSVFHGVQSWVDRISCPHCGTATTWDDIAETVSAWVDTGSGAHQCGACARPAGLNDWRWDPPMAFGYLGFTFWNWPPLRDGFVAEVAARLGHRVVVIDDKL
jgi:hypothetical protein